ncbi:expressed unknown protein [Seminavis robusta]|uniref:Uncharacterized protein n=1 Tax=Seminavis robusta TaxID=568900 RepID=A0A9N8DCG5_9STRA|nr:expressed unknown protein [Seminavis robusta]|eukprot:Sro89_g046770.1 n/a (771) ;mRNA; r:7727-10116
MGFAPLAKRCHQPLSASVLSASSLNQPEQDEENNDWNTDDGMGESTMGPEKSQMHGFVSDFLKKENEIKPEENDTTTAAENPNYFTHLIAVPMGSCHELSIELESVQRAILYHCPVLVHSCLVPATTRLPLLYVHQPGGTAVSPLAAKQAAESLEKIVQDAVQKCVYDDDSIATVIARKQESADDDDDHPIDGVNADGVRPLTLTFQSLEVDGSKNNALHTVALSDDPGTVRIQNLVAELQSTIADQLGWTTSLPPDEHLEISNPPVFRPRVPFMRLPTNFQDYLDPLPHGDELARTSEEGGNGISPIFWATWWDDVFGMARLPEIAIYPRRSPDGLAEDAFYMPANVVTLPEGNKAMTQQEAKFKDYQDQRMQQAEYDAKKEMSNESSNDFNNQEEVDEMDPMLQKTRSRLETLYQQDILEASQLEVEQDLQELVDQSKDPDRPKIDTTLLDEWTQERIKKANAAKGITMYDDDDDDEEEDKEDDKEDVIENGEENIKSIKINIANNNDREDQNELDDWTLERMRKAVESRDIAKERLNVAKDKVAIEDNPIFQKFKDGTLVPESEKPKAPVEVEIEPFPSRAQFVGFWEVMSSPTGFEPQDAGDGSTSENLVLRVDGTTAGGPILDPETKHKAAGGTWKIIPNEDGETVQLRIRLVIPPKKERILVMEGTAQKRALVSPRNNLPPMASGAFGIPALEEKQKRANDEADEELQELTREKISCSGKVWVEDAITRKNKIDIGDFSLVKLDTPRDPSQYTITIPRPIRNQD